MTYDEARITAVRAANMMRRDVAISKDALGEHYVHIPLAREWATSDGERVRPGNGLTQDQHELFNRSEHEWV